MQLEQSFGGKEKTAMPTETEQCKPTEHDFFPISATGDTNPEKTVKLVCRKCGRTITV
ncbi:MAG TPA: hypothetical protein VN950_26620 [Terriglobales bacterium]|nr:hypothetical protein [Terriglobales bacterium]